jgi:hypothetical protein
MEQLASNHRIAARYRLQIGQFGFSKKAAPDEEPLAVGYFYRKTGATTRRYIERKVGVLPVVKLVGTHIKRALVYIAQQHIAGTGAKLAKGVAHGATAIAAAAALVKHERPVVCTEPSDKG